MSTVIVTLYPPGQHSGRDLELPAEVPLRSLIPALLTALKLPLLDAGGRPVSYHLTRQHGQPPLREAESLLGAGVETGNILYLVTTASSPLPPIYDHRSLGGSALLRSFSGKVIALDNYGKSELTVGRYDAQTGRSPDIDLSDEPGGSTVSRAHARLRKQGNQWLLIHESARNITRVNHAPLTVGHPHPLQPNDVVALGGVKLVFEAGRSS